MIGMNPQLNKLEHAIILWTKPADDHIQITYRYTIATQIKLKNSVFYRHSTLEQEIMPTYQSSLQSVIILTLLTR